MKECFTPKKFRQDKLELIEAANKVMATFAADGYELTLRGCYYRMVAQNLIPNTQKSYKSFGDLISDARRAGLIDWNHLTDSTRYERTVPSWDSPATIVAACADQYDVDWWDNQLYRPVVWVEKDAMVSVIEVACRPWHIPYLSCRGYMSDSEIYAASKRYARHIENGQQPIVFHLGDHDPSGIDMTRDIERRLSMFSGHDIEVVRLALTMDQINAANPPLPPNFAKTTDARFRRYQSEYGDDSWELDAVPPHQITQLIEDAINPLIDDRRWNDSGDAKATGRSSLRLISANYSMVVTRLNDDTIQTPAKPALKKTVKKPPRKKKKD